jgi:hypothetical protein
MMQPMWPADDPRMVAVQPDRGRVA